MVGHIGVYATPSTLHPRLLPINEGCQSSARVSNAAAARCLGGLVPTGVFVPQGEVSRKAVRTPLQMRRLFSGTGGQVTIMVQWRNREAGLKEVGNNNLT